jgi:hypothetical protein
VPDEAATATVCGIELPRLAVAAESDALIQVLAFLAPDRSLGLAGTEQRT